MAAGVLSSPGTNTVPVKLIVNTKIVRKHEKWQDLSARNAKRQSVMK